jgi:hypothetical protein
MTKEGHHYIFAVVSVFLIIIFCRHHHLEEIKQDVLGERISSRSQLDFKTGDEKVAVTTDKKKDTSIPLIVVKDFCFSSCQYVNDC